MIKKHLVIIICISLIILSCKKEDKVDPQSLTWNQVIEHANGTTVRFYMWGGSEKINRWVDEYLTKQILEEYNIKLVRVAMDASVFVNKLVTEKSAGSTSGDIDLLWINGENFKNAKNANVLYGPYLDFLPNYTKYIEEKSSVFDSGFPVDGYETPYGKAQFNYIYDTDRVENVPNSFRKLEEWVKKNPGQFTYPQPPDFTGSAFIRQAFYSLTGGYEQYSEGFDNILFDKNSKKLWDYLNRIEPYLWNKGQTYPKDLAIQDKLFSRGEISFTMSFTQTEAQGRIDDGTYKKSVSSHVFEDGSLTNTHFTAIPYNSPNKAGALILSNMIISPEVQLSKIDPLNWGDFTVLSMRKLEGKYQRLFNNIDFGTATVPLTKLDATSVPEIPSEYLEALETGWNKYVLQK